MPIQGSKVLRRIQETEAHARRIEAEARQYVDGAAKEIDRLVAGQSQALRDLAEHYLPRLSADTERSAWSEIRGTLQQLILRKEDAHRQAQYELDHATRTREAAEKRWNQLCDQVNQATLHCDELARQVAQRLSEDPDFQRLARQAAESQAKLEQAEANFAQVERDAEEKLPSYEQSALFQYLLHRKFATPEYAHRGLTRRLDRWVAKLIDYPKALAGYKFLTTTPQQMKQLIEEKRGAVQLIVSEVESRQATVASALGLPRAQAEGAHLRNEQDEAALATEKSREAESNAKRRLAAIDNDRGEFYQEAIAAFQNLLQRTERSLIAARAAQTPELNDDQVVARLRHIEAELAERQRSLGQRARTAEVAGQRAAALAELAARFRRNQYDHPRSLFADEFDVDGQLWAIVEGTADPERVWQHIRRYHSLGPSMAEQTANALQHPMTQILLQTMAHVVGSALGEYASRAGQQHRRHRYDQRDWF